MDILIETTLTPPRNNKDQRGDSFRRDKKKVRKISSRMGWFCASGSVKILNVRGPFITWISEEVQLN